MFNRGDYFSFSTTTTSSSPSEAERNNCGQPKGKEWPSSTCVSERALDRTTLEVSAASPTLFALLEIEICTELLVGGSPATEDLFCDDEMVTKVTASGD